jgi:hypothetical protein
MHYANLRGNDKKKIRHRTFFPLYFSSPYGIFSWTEVVKKSLGGVPEFLVWPKMGSVFVGAWMCLRTEFCWNLPTWFVCWKGMNSKPPSILCDQQSADDGACPQTCDSDHVDINQSLVFLEPVLIGKFKHDRGTTICIPELSKKPCLNLCKNNQVVTLSFKLWK